MLKLAVVDILSTECMLVLVAVIGCSGQYGRGLQNLEGQVSQSPSGSENILQGRNLVVLTGAVGTLPTTDNNDSNAGGQILRNAL